MTSLLTRICCALSLLSIASAQFQFTTPDGNVADLSETYTVGQAYSIRWVSGWKGYGDAPDFADLFLTSWSSDAYNELMASNISFANAGTFNWRVSIPDDVVKREGNFSFKFTRALNPPNYFQADPASVLSPSRGFKVVLAQEPASSSVSSSRATLATSSTAPPSASSSASPPASSAASPTGIPPNTNDGGSSTSAGTIAGGVVGGVAALAAIVALVWFLMRRKRKAAAPNSQELYAGQQPYTDYRAPMSEMGNNEAISEMGNNGAPVYQSSLSTKYAHTAAAPQELPANPIVAEADGTSYAHGR